VERDAQQSVSGRHSLGVDDAAHAGELERITAVLLDALRVSGYLTQRTSSSSAGGGGVDLTAAAEEKARRLVRRLRFSSRDATVWSGMLRHMLWKMTQKS
jgi:tRNA C32,U32 (ribose-2'-O)-methylase TrmJ